MKCLKHVKQKSKNITTCMLNLLSPCKIIISKIVGQSQINCFFFLLILNQFFFSQSYYVFYTFIQTHFYDVQYLIFASNISFLFFRRINRQKFTKRQSIASLNMVNPTLSVKPDACGLPPLSTC